MEEHEQMLTKKNKERNLNVYVGTPNRIKRLAQKDVIKLTGNPNSTGLRYLVIDGSLNKKEQSIFDIGETKNDIWAIADVPRKHSQSIIKNLYLLMI